MLNGTWAKLNSGAWGARIEGAAQVGAAVTLTRRDGKVAEKIVARVVWSGNGVTLAEVADVNSRPQVAAAPAEVRIVGQNWPLVGGTNLYFTEEGSQHWNAMWAWLAAQPLNAGLADPTTAYNAQYNEGWQYMGTEYQEGRWADCFRHRAHPATGERVYLRRAAQGPNGLW